MSVTVPIVDPFALGLPPVMATVGPRVEETVESLLKKVKFPDGTGFTDEQIQALAAIRRPDRSSLLSVARRDFLYEIVCVCTQIGTNTVIQMIRQAEPSAVSEKLIFENGLMQNQANIYYADLDRLRSREEAITGLVECPRCHSKATVTFLVQLRRADEPPTLINKCNNCGNRWRQG